MFRGPCTWRCTLSPVLDQGRSSLGPGVVLALRVVKVRTFCLHHFSRELGLKAKKKLSVFLLTSSQSLTPLIYLALSPLPRLPLTTSDPLRIERGTPKRLWSKSSLARRSSSTTSLEARPRWLSYSLAVHTSFNGYWKATKTSPSSARIVGTTAPRYTDDGNGLPFASS